WEMNDQRVVGAIKPERVPALNDALDLEVAARIEHDVIEVGVPNHERRRHAAVETERIPGEVPNLDSLVQQIVIVRAGVFVGEISLGAALRASERGEGAPYTGKQQTTEAPRHRDHPLCLCASAVCSSAMVCSPGVTCSSAVPKSNWSCAMGKKLRRWWRVGP